MQVMDKIVCCIFFIILLHVSYVCMTKPLLLTLDQLKGLPGARMSQWHKSF